MTEYSPSCPCVRVPAPVVVAVATEMIEAKRIRRAHSQGTLIHARHEQFTCREFFSQWPARSVHPGSSAFPSFVDEWRKAKDRKSSQSPRSSQIASDIDRDDYCAMTRRPRGLPNRTRGGVRSSEGLDASTAWIGGSPSSEPIAVRLRLR